MIRQPLHLNRNRPVSIALILLLLIFTGINTAFALDTRPLKHLFDLAKAQESPLNLPSDVAIAPDGRIYVVDGGNHRVVVYAANGEFLNVLGSKGHEAGQFSAPLGITADKTGRVYIADSGNFRVQVFDKSNQLLREIPIRENNNNIKPVDVAISPSMDVLYVTGNTNHRVMLFDIQGKKLGQWGKEGNNPSEFRYPATLAVGKDGAVYVVDVLNSRVQIFEPSGKLRTTAGSWGVLPGNLFRPKGVALDKDENIYVSDSYLDVVEVFNNNTSFSHVLGANNQARKFISPAGMAIDVNNRIYVTEMLENKVSVYLLE